MDTLETIGARRSVRAYGAEPVPRETIEWDVWISILPGSTAGAGTFSRVVSPVFRFWITWFINDSKIKTNIFLIYNFLYIIKHNNSAVTQDPVAKAK